MTSKELKIKEFDANGLGIKGNNLFGLPFDDNEANTIVIPVPWEVTVSYSSGTANGPEAILNASLQVDLFDPNIKDAWQSGIYMTVIDQKLRKKSDKLREKARKIIDAMENGIDVENDKKILKDYQDINEACAEMVEWVKAETFKYLKQGKMVALLGGDHSTPLGFIKALTAIYPKFAVLQIDAHADLRVAYEGFEYSHASIMYNVLKEEQVSKLVQVGIRDYCEAEAKMVTDSNGRIKTFYDADLKAAQYEGETWKKTCEKIIKELPNEVFISFDIDGLDPKLCPNTGTPVAGGFELEQIFYLVNALVKSGKKIIGFDLNEVSPGNDEWDANVGARILYKLCNLMAVSQGKIAK